MILLTHAQENIWQRFIRYGIFNRQAHNLGANGKPTNLNLRNYLPGRPSIRHCASGNFSRNDSRLFYRKEKRVNRELNENI